MTISEFECGLLGDGRYTKDMATKVRYMVADALDEQAKERRVAGRRDIAARINWLSGQIRVGGHGSSRVYRMLAKDIEIVKGRLVDGIPA